MHPMKWLIFSLMFAFCGCQSTLFVHDIALKQPSCDIDISGYWQSVPENPEQPEKSILYAYFMPNCQLQLTIVDAEHPQTMQPMVTLHPNIVQIGDATFLSLTNNEDIKLMELLSTEKKQKDRYANSGEDKLRSTKPTQTGFHIMKIQKSKQSLKIWMVDHDAVAKAIEGKKLKGSVERSDGGFVNTVNLDTSEARRLMAKDWVFSTDQKIELLKTELKKMPEMVQKQIQITQPR